MFPYDLYHQTLDRTAGADDKSEGTSPHHVRAAEIPEQQLSAIS